MAVSRSYPDIPLIAISVLCRRGQKVLMVRRGNEPFKDHWSLPGGMIEVGESLAEAADRELQEETTIEARMHEVGEVFDSIQKDADGRVKSHYVLAVMLATYKSGAAVAGDDAAEVRWIAPQDSYALLTTPDTPERIERLLKRFPQD
ncbi:NUDIX domain-containing protein [Roseibium sp. CAU 1637]|uniref:NUDIX domain-containing protein n=1 Tax=Roseibium limicola TaxID=2816037 RepID=A0A939J9L1_9HYPH|nr:NUDIX domain-containing protein [Roseibium limicola]MBO0345503.1 NUDIX domain-containing protein [Roseibium limicola]